MKNSYKILAAQLSKCNTGEMPEVSFDSIKDICNITNPKSILEIGFNRGSSALMWLLNSNAKLTSIDVRKEQEIIHSLSTLKSNFKDRFTYYKMDAYRELPFKSEWIGKFDLIFIDCWHDPIGYELDTNTAMYLGSPVIVYDDYLTHPHSSFIRNLVKDNHNLKEIKTYSNGYFEDMGQSIIQNLNHQITSGNDMILKYIKILLEKNKKELDDLEKTFKI